MFSRNPTGSAFFAAITLLFALASADASDLDRYRGVVRREMILAFVFKCLFGVANLLFLYGLVSDRFDLGHVLAVVVFDGVLFALARSGLRLGDEAKALSVREPRCRDEFHRLTAQWETRVLPEWR